MIQCTSNPNKKFPLADSYEYDMASLCNRSNFSEIHPIFKPCKFLKDSGKTFGMNFYCIFQAPPHYHYDYAVHDLKHHDIKSQWETRDHDETKGVYTLLQPDGRKRIVEYVAGKHGVDYKVKYEGHSEHGGIGALSR